jgi:hypothetical protein
MASIDAQNVLAEDQAITATAVSEDEIELQSGDLGSGQPIFVRSIVTADFTSGNANEALEIQVQEYDGSAWNTVTTSEPVGKASLVKGYELPPLLVPSSMGKKIRVNYVVSGTGNFTGGTITTFLARDRG